MYKCILSVLAIILAINSYALADEVQPNTSSEYRAAMEGYDTVEQGLARMREQNGQFFDAISGLNARSSVVHRLTGVSFDMLSIDDNDSFELMPYVELPFFGERASLVKDYSFFSSLRYLSINEGDYEQYEFVMGIKGEITEDKFLDLYSIIGWNIMIGAIYFEEDADHQTFPEFNSGWSYFIGTFNYGWEIRWDFSFRVPETGGYMLNYLETMLHFAIGNAESFFVTLRPGFQTIWRASLHNDVKSGLEIYKAYVRVGFQEFVVVEPYLQYDNATEKSGIGIKLSLFYSF